MGVPPVVVECEPALDSGQYIACGDGQLARRDCVHGGNFALDQIPSARLFCSAVCSDRVHNTPKRLARQYRPGICGTNAGYDDGELSSESARSYVAGTADCARPELSPDSGREAHNAKSHRRLFLDTAL